jgi:hypothetical protein
METVCQSASVQEFRDVRAGVDRLDAFHGRGGRRVDRGDLAVRHIAALEGDVTHADDLDVVDVGALSLNETRILAALHARADELGKNGRRHHFLPAPAAAAPALAAC